MHTLVILLSIIFLTSCNPEEKQANQELIEEFQVMNSKSTNSSSRYTLKVSNITSTSFKAYYDPIANSPWMFIFYNGNTVLADRNKREYHFTELTPGKKYTVSGLIRFVGGTEHNIPEVSVTLPTASTNSQPVGSLPTLMPTLVQPVLSSSSATETSITTMISPVSGATNYNYQLIEKNTKVIIKSESSSKTSMEFTGLKSLTLYSFRVSATANGYNQSEFLIKDIQTSAPKQNETQPAIITNPPTASAPYQLHITNVTSTSFKAYYNQIPNWPWMFIFFNGGTVLSDRSRREYQFAGLIPGKTYSISGLIRFIGGPEYNVPSLSVTLPSQTTSAPPSAPPSTLPSLSNPNLKSLNQTTDSVNLSIMLIASATSYKFQLFKTGSLVEEITNTNATASFSKLLPATAYLVKVIASANGFNSSSSSFQFTTQAAVTSPIPSTAGTAIETFGANPFYTFDKFFGTIDIKYVTPTKSVITYKGADSPFTSEFLNKEFVAFRSHENPVKPSADVNFYPGKITSRYSRVINVIDGKNLEVDFGYNGGDLISPKNTFSAFGYFFFDNRLAFANAINSQSRSENVLLKSGKVYVTKGGWNATPLKTLNIITDGSSKAAIKISWEDSLAPLEENDPATSSFIKQYGSGVFFKLATNNFSVKFINIDLLPTLYTIKQTQPSGGLFFNHPYSNVNKCVATRELSFTNSNPFKEFEIYKSKYPNLPPGYYMNLPVFAHSLCGGKDDGYDITHFQEFKLQNSSWVSGFVFDVKNNHYRAGNLLRIQGDSEQRARVFSTKEGSINRINGVSVRFEKDEMGEYRLVKILSKDVTAYEMANLYWNGGLSGAKTHFLETPEGRISFCGKPDFDYIEGVDKWPREFIKDAKTFRVCDAIPILGKSYKILSHLSPNIIRVHGVTVFKGDTLSINGAQRKVLSIERPTSQGTIHHSDLTLDGPVSTSSTNFMFLNTPSQRYISGSTANLIYNLALIGYLTYTSKNMNVIWENVDLQGEIRASTHLDEPADDKILYKQAKHHVFINAHYKGPTMSPSTGAVNEFVESTDFMVRSNLTGKPHHAIIDNSTIYWSRKQANYNEIMLKNKPTIIYGGSSVGGPRFVGGIHQDGQGFVIDTGDLDDFQFEAIDGKDWNLSNITIKSPNSSSSLSLRFGGYGSINISGLKRFTNSIAKFPTIYLGLPHALNLNQPGNLKIYGSNGEASIGLFHSSYKKGSSETFFDLDNWILGPGLEGCSGNCFNNTWNNIQINN